MHKWIMVHLPSVSGSGQGESQCTNRSLAKIHAHGRHWAELSLGMFGSQVKKLLKRRESRTRSISGDAQRYTRHACPLSVLPLLKYRREGLQKVYSASLLLACSGALAAFRLLLPAPCFVRLGICLSGN